MGTTDPQVVDSEEFIDILDYQFLGNDVTVQNKRTFIEHLRVTSTIYLAAHKTGINKLTAYRWRSSDPQFAEAMKEALEDSADVMETSTYQKALGEPDSQGRYTNGDSLLKMFWLKAHRVKFRDRIAVDVQAIQREVKEHINALMSQRQPIVATGSNDGVLQLPAPTTEFIPDIGRPHSHASQVDKTLDIVELARQQQR